MNLHTSVMYAASVLINALLKSFKRVVLAIPSLTLMLASASSVVNALMPAKPMH